MPVGIRHHRAVPVWPAVLTAGCRWSPRVSTSVLLFRIPRGIELRFALAVCPDGVCSLLPVDLSLRPPPPSFQLIIREVGSSSCSFLWFGFWNKGFSELHVTDQKFTLLQ